MHTELFSLSKLFTENLFRIPDYQRGYAWTERQLKDFWTDLTLLSDGRDHYTGVLTLEEVDDQTYSSWSDDLWIIKSRRFRPYYVVDGQQRLTTSLLLIQVILEHVGPSAELNYFTIEDIRRKFLFESKDKGVSRSYIFGYERDDPSYEFLKTRIFLEPSDNHELGEQTIYTSNLLAAKQFLRERLSGMPIQEVETIFSRLTQHFLYNIYTISKDIDVFVAFEAMNNRGKPLSHLELLKNRLIYLSTRLQAEDSERGKLRKVINESWKRAYHYLGRNQRNPLDDNAFLKLHFTLHVGLQLLKQSEEKNAGKDAEEEEEEEDERVEDVIGYYTRGDNYKDYLLDELFTTASLDDEDEDRRKHDLSVRYLYEYAHDLKKTVKLYYELLNPDDSLFADSQKLWLTRINRLGWGGALPLTVVAAEQVEPGVENDDFLSFLEALERLLFVDALSIYDPEVQDLDLVAMALRLKSKSTSLVATTTEIANYLDLFLRKHNLEAHLLDQARRRGFYHWRLIRYFLFEYEQYLKAKARETRDKLKWDEFVGREYRRNVRPAGEYPEGENYRRDFRTIEHIYPQRATHAYWRTQFRGFSPKQRDALRHSLGNLLPLSAAKNASLSNRPFPEKRGGGTDTIGYAYGCYSEIDVSQLSDWTPRSILDRGIDMLDFMEQRWCLQIGDREAKKRALGLHFV